jgi:hypothetical protein
MDGLQETVFGQFLGHSFVDRFLGVSLGKDLFRNEWVERVEAAGLDSPVELEVVVEERRRMGGGAPVVAGELIDVPEPLEALVIVETEAKSLHGWCK